ncbi:unnamed protein product [Durusdinium trenchii]|uniref:EF-hand domain-containing protein n=2 Tax=Durusdinium trenchii TaxID=1381693 RepID=A0ABP0JL95_9DINO
MLPSCEFMRMSAEVEHEESKAEMVHSDPEAPIVVSMTPAPEFQVESLQLLLLEQEQRIKLHFDQKIEELQEHMVRMVQGPTTSPTVPHHRMPHERMPRTSRRSSGRESGDATRGASWGVPKNFIEMVHRVMDSEGLKHSPSQKTSTVVRKLRCAWLPVLWHYFVDFIALSYVIFIGINLQFGSHGGPLEWALPIEILFCSVIGVDLLVKMCTQQQKFFTGPRRWWNFFDSFCLLVLIVAAAQGSRGLETASGLVRGGRALRIVGCFSTVQELRQFKQLRVMIASMIRSLKVMLWPALMVFVFNYFCGLILTESMWSNCPNSSILCEKFGDLQSSMITLYQIQYSGMLWHEVWHEMQHSEWYVQVFFICSTVFGLMVVVNATTSFMCGLQSYIWKKERATFSDLEEELKKFYASFREIDQNHNGTISEVEFKLVMENEQMLALLEALDVDTSDAVKVFEILASQSTGGIEVTDFLLGCLRLQRGTTAVDIIRIQMQQEWGHDALVSMSTVLQKTSADFQEALHSLSITTTAMEPLSAGISGGGPSLTKSWTRRQSIHAVPELMASNDEEELREVLRHNQRTNLGSEDRAVTVPEMQQLLQELFGMCDGWKDAFTGKAVQSGEANLYQFAYHCILPRTAPYDGVLLQWPASMTVIPEAGQEVCQRSGQMEMALPVARGKVLRAEKVEDVHGEKLKIWIRLLQGQFQPMCSEIWCGTSVLPGEEMSVVAEKSISYKEHLSTRACKSEYYTSHWWGEPVRSFVQCCRKHAELRRLEEGTGYWVCGYANRQHELGLDIADDVVATSFFAALKTSKGLLVILDEKATPFSRIWCDFELYAAIMNKAMELDIAAAIGTEKTRILTTNLVPGESSVAKTKREQDFPIDLLGRGLELCLEEGNATVKEDKEHIFRAIADNYDLSSEEGEAMQKKGRPGMDKICNALRSDGFRESLELSLAHVEGCDNAAVKKLAESLPSSLKNLKLSFEGCSHLTDSSVQALAGQVSQLKSLEILHLDFVGCEYLTDASLKSVGDRVSKSKLIELELHFAGCKRLQEGGAFSLQENLPESLRRFKANFKGTHVDRTFDNLTQFKGYQKSWRPFPFELTA